MIMMIIIIGIIVLIIIIIIIKRYEKNDNEIDSLIKTEWQCSKDIKMEFGTLKCAVVSLQRGKNKMGRNSTTE